MCSEAPNRYKVPRACCSLSLPHTVKSTSGAPVTVNPCHVYIKPQCFPFPLSPLHPAAFPHASTKTLQLRNSIWQEEMCPIHRWSRWQNYVPKYKTSHEFIAGWKTPLKSACTWRLMLESACCSGHCVQLLHQSVRVCVICWPRWMGRPLQQSPAVTLVWPRLGRGSKSLERLSNNSPHPSHTAPQPPLLSNPPPPPASSSHSQKLHIAQSKRLGLGGGWVGGWVRMLEEKVKLR